MQLVTYYQGSTSKIGVLDTDQIVDISMLAPDMLTLIDGGPEMLSVIRKTVETVSDSARMALAQATLRAPIPRPRKNIVCLGMNYAAHAYESARAKGLPEKLPSHPVFFTKAPTTIAAPGAAVSAHAAVTRKYDWEVELAVIIGKAGRDIAPADALSYIFGYTILNDLSARDLQKNHQQFYKAKSLDGSAPLGPCIVTADELTDPHSLGLRLRLNGQTMQESTTADMIFKLPEIIAVLSRGTTIEPGDIISTGTPSGVAMGMAEPRYLQPGDQIDAEIDGIGVLHTPITD